MWGLIAVMLLSFWLTVPARSEVVFAYPDSDPANATYYWGRQVVSGGVPLSDAIQRARRNGGSSALEIRFLRRADTAETRFQLDLGSTQRALRWRGAADRQLKLVGQVDRSGPEPRALTVVVGRSLKETICTVRGIDLCASTMQEPVPQKRQDVLDYLSAEMVRRNIIKGGEAAAQDVDLRLHCLLMWASSHVEIEEMGFRDCWLAAIVAYSSSHIALRGSVIRGSTYAFAAIGREGHPETAHSFEVTGNIWRQSPSEFRIGQANCDATSDWNCPISIWHDVPWAIVHHFFWSPLNGALFVSKDIAGNVKIHGNHVYDAYNAIRAKLSAVCLGDRRCRERANLGFEIAGNFFGRIRDNAVEPEGRAAFWVVKHNTFVDVYAAISTDGVAGHDLLVFGNAFLLTSAPGGRCQDGKWNGSRQFRLSLGGGGRWSLPAAEGDDARCSTHVLGTVIKLGAADDSAPDAALLQRILFFNNSLRTRSPLFRGSPAPPVVSYNNAVQFTGCGDTGAIACRQQPETDPGCSRKQIWTIDREALLTDCFPLLDARAQPISHRMRHNAYAPPPAAEFDAVDRDRGTAAFRFDEPQSFKRLDRKEVDAIFAISRGHSLASGGCSLRYVDGDIECTGEAAALGAFLPSGERFDLNLPFEFPFFDMSPEGQLLYRRRAH